MNALDNGTIKSSLPPLYTKCIWYDYWPIPEFVSSGKLAYTWIESYCNVANENCKRYQLENYGRSMPDNLLPDGTLKEKLTRFED